MIMKIRRVISLTMFLSFSVLAYTGIMLFLSPQGRVAYWTGWQLLGLSKDQYSQLHTTFMIIFVVAGVWHVTLNWKAIKNYLRGRSREIRIFTAEFNVALLLAVVFAVGTLAGVAPWSSFLTWEATLKDYWERKDGSPPWGHAEESTLARFTRGLVDWERIEHERSVRLPVQDALAALRGAGLTVESENQRIIEIANANKTTPQALMPILRDAELPVLPDEAGGAPPRTGEGPFPLPYAGLGRMTLRDYCQKYDFALEVLLSLLPSGLTVDSNRTLRELAEELNTDPGGVIEMLNRRWLDRRPTVTENR
jgi:hypothetical protein